jgi:hypothetical protein
MATRLQTSRLTSGPLLFVGRLGAPHLGFQGVADPGNRRIHRDHQQLLVAPRQFPAHRAAASDNVRQVVTGQNAASVSDGKACTTPPHELTTRRLYARSARS